MIWNQQGVAAVEAALAGILISTFLLFAAAMLQIFSVLLVKYQSEQFLLCRADGIDRSLCFVRTERRIHQLAPWITQIRITDHDDGGFFRANVTFQQKILKVLPSSTLSARLGRQWSRRN